MHNKQFKKYLKNDLLEFYRNNNFKSKYDTSIVRPVLPEYTVKIFFIVFKRFSRFLSEKSTFEFFAI